MKESFAPYQFDEFFASGLSETTSPFLTKRSRKWGENLSLKQSILAAVLLSLSFILSFFSLDFAHLLLSFVYFLVGTSALINAIEDLLNLEINIDILMTLAAFLSILIGSGFEGALLLVLFEFSGALEDSVSFKAKGAIHSLHHLSPKMAYVIENNLTFQKSVRDIEIGAQILVKAGEVIPLDGKILEGSSSINLVHLTGESLPVRKHEKDEVPAGAQNLESALIIEVTRKSRDSTVSRIINLITEAHNAKPKAQKLLDRLGKTYSTLIILLTLTFAIALPLFFSISYFGKEGAIYRALSFMIAASPCALIIATPTAYLSAISACARKGIILKGGITLDALSSISSIAFDKTGTLTTGKLSLTSIIPLNQSSIPINDALSIAASLERHIIHPIATAILKKAETLPLFKIENFSSVPGLGLLGQVVIQEIKREVAIGRIDYIYSLLTLEQKEGLKDLFEQISTEKKMISLLKIDNALFSFIFEDILRPSSQEMIFNIRTKNKLQPIMLTGDRKDSAKEIASILGIDTYFYDLKPEDKLSLIASFSEKENLAMVGDGINDAPALARSTVGISMGKAGSSTAIDASDVILLNDDLHLLPYLFTKSKKTIKIVKQNLTLALGVILLATTPALLGYIPLWLAVVLHEGGTVLVGLNSLRLLK